MYKPLTNSRPNNRTTLVCVLATTGENYSREYNHKKASRSDKEILYAARTLSRTSRRSMIGMTASFRSASLSEGLVQTKIKI